MSNKQVEGIDFETPVKQANAPVKDAKQVKFDRVDEELSRIFSRLNENPQPVLNAIAKDETYYIRTRVDAFDMFARNDRQLMGNKDFYKFCEGLNAQGYRLNYNMGHDLLKLSFDKAPIRTAAAKMAGTISYGPLMVLDFD